MNPIPRSEYPRPQFRRAVWLCLNGTWDFEIDRADDGVARGLLARPLSGKILVPFCPESKLSGICDQSFLNAVWYRRRVTIPAAWHGRRVALHFQAVDYDATVWVNGRKAGCHRGGFSPFSIDLSGFGCAGDTLEITVRARDFASRPQARGKQAKDLQGSGAIYCRTTGIWQTVWLEPLPTVALARTRITPQVAQMRFHLQQPLSGGAYQRAGLSICSTLYSGAEVICQSTTPADSDLTPCLDLNIPAQAAVLWSPARPHLYDLVIELLDSAGHVIDKVQSYAGLRAVTISGAAIRLNGEILFQRLVLDQGYYPDGIMTAPDDEALVRDIELSQSAGFNGARLHQKVFEERYLYHADRLGYLVWGEFADWGCARYGPTRGEHQKPGPDYITQWLEVLQRDYSHPSIIGWCPLNETWQFVLDEITQLDDVTRGLFLATKAMDSTRPVLDASGYSHRVTASDIYDSHDYTQNVEEFRRRHEGLGRAAPYINDSHGSHQAFSIPYGGQPYFVSEFGGIWWNPALAEHEDSWGYGERPKTLEEFYQRFEGLCRVLLQNGHMFGYCYTQLTDVFQEQNGIFTFDREPKFDLNRLVRIQSAVAAIEKSR